MAPRTCRASKKDNRLELKKLQKRRKQVKIAMRRHREKLTEQQLEERRRKDRERYQRKKEDGQDERQDSKSNPVTDVEDNDNTYTEVVYLEQDSAPEDSRPIEKPKLTTPFTKRAKKRARNSTSSELPIKLKKEKFDRKEDLHQEDSELDAFIKYIRCLLKKLTPDVFSKVQVDILKTIMDAQYSQKVAATDSGTSILTDIATGNVTNIIRVNEIAPENSSLLGNYTVTLSSKSDELNSSK